MSFPKKSIIAVLFLSTIVSFSQVRETATFGKPLEREYEMESYSKDPDAAGVVLFESGNNHFELIEHTVKLVKEVHVKMKVFDAKKFEQSTVFIPYYNERNNNENVTKIVAITHNGPIKTYVKPEDIYDTDETPKWSLKKFTFPNIKDGSILEYTYRIETGHYLNFGGWEFQGELPKLYSEFHTELPGNFKYNRTLYGNLNLDINEAEKTLACFSIEGFDVQAECEIATYAIFNVPAAKKEKYMLSPENYLASLKYELIEYVDFEESKHPFTRDWDDVDHFLQYDRDLGRQLKYSSYFKGQVPESLLSIPGKLERAKAIYYFIQDRMAWDGKYRILSEVRVKDAFDRKSGNSSEINLALINALAVADIDAKIMLISTRDYAIPTLQYPVLTDFIYALAYLELDGKKYFLDATDKETPFGVLPYRDLCTRGRVLDFKKGSYWEPIVPASRNMHYVNLQMAADDNGIFHGTINEVSTGYVSVEKRKEFNNLSTTEIIKRKQAYNEFLDISDLEIENKTDLEQPYKEKYNFSIHDQHLAGTLFLYPFAMQTYFAENPFNEKTRTYPMDFGFPITNNYLVSIDLNNQYEVVKTPGNKLLKLPENDGEISVVYDVSGTKINIRLGVKLNNYSFAPEAYQSLQEFFGTLMQIEKEEPIELKKI